MCSKDFKQIFITFVKKSLEYNSAPYKLKQILAKRTTDFFETDCCGLNSSVYSFVSIDLLVCLCVCCISFLPFFLSICLSFVCSIICLLFFLIVHRQLLEKLGSSLD